MWRGTRAFPFFVHDPYSLSTASAKGERKSHRGRRFVGQQHPYARAGSVTGSSGTVECPVGGFSHTAPQTMKRVWSAGEEIQLNQNNDSGSGLALAGHRHTATSDHHCQPEPVPSCRGERNDHREQRGNLASTSYRVEADHKLVVDSSSTSQRSNQSRLCRDTGTDPKLPQTQKSNKGRGRRSRTTVQQREPGHHGGDAHHMQHSRGRGRGEFGKNKDNMQQIQQARGRGRGRGCGNEGHAAIQNKPGHSLQLHHAMGGGQGTVGVRHQNKPEFHFNKPELHHTNPRKCHAELYPGNLTLQHKNALLCQDKKQYLNDTRPALEHCSETESVVSCHSVVHKDPVPNVEHATCTQTHAPQGVNKPLFVEQSCDTCNTPDGCSKSEKMEVVSTYLSVKPDLATQEKIGTTPADTPKCTQQSVPMELPSTPNVFTPQAQPDVNVITEPCFQSQMQIGRSWSYCQKANEGNNFTFTVVSYNILADQLLKNNHSLYDGYPEWLLDWEYRKINLLKEILEFRADILCLQEVQSEHYYQWFEPNLERAGYHGIFKKRTGDKPDGCATFFKVTKFSLVQSKFIEFRKKEVAILDRDNVALATLLQPKVQYQPLTPQGHTDKRESGDNLLCVANTHLLFNTNRGEIKLLQLAMLFAELDQLAHRPSHNQVPPDQGQASGARTDADYPIILCGDFNSQPFSPLYSFVTRGVIQYAGMSRTAISGQNKPQFSYRQSLILHRNLIPKGLKITDYCQWYRSEEHPTNENADSVPVSRNSSCLWHGFNFHSVYRHFILNGQPEVTTCHNLVCCTVDYIFYSRPRHQGGNHDSTSSPGCGHAQLELTGVLNLLGRNQLANSGGLPNRFLSSDHFALAASFVLKS